MILNNKKAPAVFAVALLAASIGAHAQSGPVRPAYEFPSGKPGEGAVQMGDSPFFAAPYGSVSLGYDSNIFTLSQNEKDSPTQLYVAGVRVDAKSSNSYFFMNIDTRYGRYTDSTADNYSDPSFRSSYDMALDQRNFLRLGYNYIRGHDPRGSTDRPAGSSPDKYSDSIPSLTYAYGAPGAKGRVEFFYDNDARRYLNNRQYTEGSDRDTRNFGGALYGRVMPKTSLIAEIRLTNIDYKLGTSKLSGDETRYLVGVTWEATAATSGTVKIGRLEKNFDSTYPGYSGSTWEGMVTWLPRSYSKLDIYTGRQPVETTGVGTFTLSDRSGANWSHAWSSVLSTDVFGSYTKDRFQENPRTDETTVLGLRASYKFRRWLTLGAEYSHTNRDSNQSLYNYDRDIYFITAGITM